ncbi:MAG: hypothetical protein ABIK62_07620, partial [candidate division WOR-3 bacterium]
IDRRRVRSDVRYEEVKASIRAELLPFKQQQTVENFTKQLAAKAKVEVLPDNFYRETFGVRRTQGAPQ